MVKDTDIIQAVRDQDTEHLNKILNRIKNGKKLINGAKKINVNHQDQYGMTALHQAALQGNVEYINLLLNNGATVDIKDKEDMNPLHYAAWQGFIEPVNLLLDAGTHVNHPSKTGETSLHLACQHGHAFVVRLLLKYQADPRVENHHFKTPLDLACEFGRDQVVELLIRSTLCEVQLRSSRDLSSDKERTTPLHLAAKGGHANVISLLFEAGVDVNRQTPQGTALHEAAMYGKIDAVRILIEAGVDSTTPNSYDQTALDIVNKFTKKAGAKELKQLLKEASNSVLVRAVKSYTNSNDAQSLTFYAGDLIMVTEQRADGIWKGFVKTGEVRRTHVGYFPSNCVAVMDKLPRSQSDVVGNDIVLGAEAARPWYSSNNLTDMPSPSVRFPPNQNLQNDACGNTNGNCQYPPPSPSYRNTEMASIPENNMMSMSGRLSAASNDNRPPVYHSPSTPQSINANVMISNSYPQRLSSHSYDSRHSYDRYSYHSNSSSSMGSLDVLEEIRSPGYVDIHELRREGHQDGQILSTWLASFGFECYIMNFLKNGYDLATVSRMTPEDLTAIGISKPGHRKRLKREISRLSIEDGLPEIPPNSVYDWLHKLGLGQYYETFEQQQYNTVESMMKITFEDLQEIGINLLGHLKKISLSVEKLKKANRRRSNGSVNSSTASTPISSSVPGWSSDSLSSGAVEGRQRQRSTSGDMITVRSNREGSPFSAPASKSINEILQLRNSMRYNSDIQPIQTRPTMSRSSSGNSVNSNGEYPAPQVSFTDRNTPPSSEDGSSCSGSMSRQHLQKKGPMRGIHGLTMSKHGSQDSMDQQRNSMEIVGHYATLRNSRKQSSHSLEFNMSQGLPSPTTPKTNLKSPFDNFQSPYAQIQSGMVKNQLPEKRSSSVPSSPVGKTAPESFSNTQTRKPPPPPVRTLSMKRSSSREEKSEESESFVDETQFPPPLAPVAFDLETLKGAQTKPKVVKSQPTLKLQDVGISSIIARRRMNSNSDERKNLSNNNNTDTSHRPESQPYSGDVSTSEDNSESEFDFDTVKRNPKPVMSVPPVPAEKTLELSREPQASPLKKNEIQNLESMFDSCLNGIDAMLT